MMSIDPCMLSAGIGGFRNANWNVQQCPYMGLSTGFLVLWWAVNTDHSEGQVWLSVHVNGVHRSTCLTQHSRPGVTLPQGAAAPENCEFRFEFDPPLSAFDEHRIEVSEIWSGEI